jgi:hypothetical protein
MVQSRGELIESARKRAVVIYLVIAAALLVLCVFVTQYDMNSLVVKPNPNGYACNVSMRIVTPTWSLEYTGERTMNVTVVEFLHEAAQALNISIEEVYYSSYHSYFVSGINRVVNGDDGLYWQYYVNGSFPLVGCSQYVLHDGDMVEWRFEKPSWG